MPARPLHCINFKRCTMDPLSSLPDTVLVHIFSFSFDCQTEKDPKECVDLPSIDVPHLLSTKLVSKRFAELFRAHSILGRLKAGLVREQRLKKRYCDFLALLSHPVCVIPCYWCNCRKSDSFKCRGHSVKDRAKEVSRLLKTPVMKKTKRVDENQHQEEDGITR